MQTIRKVQWFAIVFSSLPHMLSAAADHESMTVYAGRIQGSLSNTPATVQIVTAEELQTIAGSGENLGSLLGKLVPGLGSATQSVSQFGQKLRGREVLIILDGIPQTENRQISRQWSTINPLMIDRIEILSGSHAIYGAGAPGGIIHIRTKAYAPQDFRFVSSIGSSFATDPLSSASGSYTLLENVSGTLGAWSYLLALGGELRQKSYDAKGQLIPPEPAQISRHDTQSISVLGKLLYQLSDQQQLELRLDTFTEQQDSKMLVATQPYRALEGLKLERQPFSARKQAVLSYQDENLAGQKLLSQVYYRERNYGFFPFLLTQPFPVLNQSTSKAELIGWKNTLSEELSEQIHLTYGFDWERERAQQSARSYDAEAFLASEGRFYQSPSLTYDYGPEIETDKKALFAQGRYLTPTGNGVHLGLRYEAITQSLRSFIPPLETAFQQNWARLRQELESREALGQIPSGSLGSLPLVFPLSRWQGGQSSYEASAFNLGWTYSAPRQQKLFLNFSQGYDLADTARLLRDAVAEASFLPRLAKLFQLNLRSSTLADLELEAIRTSHIETGWRIPFEGFSLQTALFYNESDKVYQFTKDYRVELLDSKKRVYGLEAELEAQLNDETSLMLSYSRSKGEAERTAGKGWQRLSAIEVPPPKINFRLTQHWGEQWTGQLLWQHVDSYRGDDFTVRPYASSDAHLIWRPTSLWELRGSITQLTQTSYKTVFHQWAEATYGPASGAPASGRRMHLQVSREF